MKNKPSFQDRLQQTADKLDRAGKSMQKAGMEMTKAGCSLLLLIPVIIISLGVLFGGETPSPPADVSSRTAVTSVPSSAENVRRNQALAGQAAALMDNRLRANPAQSREHVFAVPQGEVTLTQAGSVDTQPFERSSLIATVTVHADWWSRQPDDRRQQLLLWLVHNWDECVEEIGPNSGISMVSLFDSLDRPLAVVDISGRIIF